MTAPPARRCLMRFHSGPSAAHLLAKCSSRTDKAMLASNGERIPPYAQCRVMRSAGVSCLVGAGSAVERCA
jgi:hypothetical protein